MILNLLSMIQICQDETSTYDWGTAYTVSAAAVIGSAGHGSRNLSGNTNHLREVGSDNSGTASPTQAGPTRARSRNLSSRTRHGTRLSAGGSMDVATQQPDDTTTMSSAISSRQHFETEGTLQSLDQSMRDVSAVAESAMDLGDDNGEEVLQAYGTLDSRPRRQDPGQPSRSSGLATSEARY